MTRIILICLMVIGGATTATAQQVISIPTDSDQTNPAPTEYDAEGNPILPDAAAKIIFTTNERPVWVDIKGKTLTLRGLDKISGFTKTFEAEIGQVVEYRRLKITVDVCYTRPAEAPPESSAYIQIEDSKFDPPDNIAFSGWMFASSPALSAMDHPRYDIWILNCKG